MSIFLTILHGHVHFSQRLLVGGYLFLPDEQHPIDHLCIFPHPLLVQTFVASLRLDFRLNLYTTLIGQPHFEHETPKLFGGLFLFLPQHAINYVHIKY
jgi:hypothetical protein